MLPSRAEFAQFPRISSNPPLYRGNKEPIYMWFN
jgi:hypothetical protein